jgi:L-amino acid N-acyltransferase YncA
VSPVHLRDATRTDAVPINALYNATISTTTALWTEELESLAMREPWLEEQRQLGNPVLVAEAEGRVIGFASYDDFRNSVKWPGYRFTVEHTIHVEADHQGAGVGGTLLGALIERASAAGKHAMIGAIDSENVRSIALHGRHGFVAVARLPQVGYKFGRWCDLVLMQRVLS